MTGEYGAEDAGALVGRARAGDPWAYRSLYERFLPMVRHTANSVVRDAHEADDLAHEAFYLVFRAIKAGRGPDDSFGGYIMSTVRRIAFRHAATRNRMWLAADVTEQESGAHDPAPASKTLDDVATAWSSLPHRWREILWLVEVDRYSPAELATRLAMSPTAVSSLATRARDALRTAYLAQQVLGDDVRCADIAPRLVELARGTLATRRRAALLQHVGSCGTCSHRLASLARRRPGQAVAATTSA